MALSRSSLRPPPTLVCNYHLLGASTPCSITLFLLPTKKQRNTVTAGSEATADSGSLEVDARLISRFARSRASLCLARVVLRWLGVSKQSQRSPSCPRAGLTNWQQRQLCLVTPDSGMSQ